MLKIEIVLKIEQGTTLTYLLLSADTLSRINTKPDLYVAILVFAPLFLLLYYTKEKGPI